MNVLVLQVFVTLMLVVGAVVLFAYSVKQADHEHADRLSLFPLEEDGAPAQRDRAAPGPKNETTNAPTAGIDPARTGE